MLFTKTEEVALDQLIANFTYATNTLFAAVEHDHVIKMIRMFRPGYIQPNRHQLGRHLLDQSFSSVTEVYLQKLKGETVCMAMDGWSNVNKEPTLALTLSVDDNININDCVDITESRHSRLLGESS